MLKRFYDPQETIFDYLTHPSYVERRIVGVAEALDLSNNIFNPQDLLKLYNLSLTLSRVITAKANAKTLSNSPKCPARRWLSLLLEDA
ncbi:hypothetical protein PENSUB_5704 [Penicillium subrubescens]|uniref:Uncharacterized protein n=1 Tax=Penicillium subrubescens TaxID=1316194 RepID=A0A1Q5U778_9EURO|nr:hypothetical protein PENSUB_5704 [Penicillium subrubescens]